MSEFKYDLKTDAEPAAQAPALPYQPPQPKHYRPRIGLIGCGGITRNHLDAYKTAGWEVAALCDWRLEAAEARRQEFFPAAWMTTDFHALLARPDIDVVDIALHPEPRVAVIEAALRAGKHVLSQKPFVLDLDTGERLVRLAEENNVKLAVNQNGRWSPYVSYMRHVISAGLIGSIQSVSMALNWDHTGTKGTAYEKIHHLVLYDFGIHWIDMMACFFAGRECRTVYAQVNAAPTQDLACPLLAQVMFGFDGGGGMISFDAHSKFDPAENITVTGALGTLRARGPICGAHDLTLATTEGVAQISLEGKWFNDGFRGTMGELLCAIEDQRVPDNDGRSNLRSLSLCFAAMASANTGGVQIPGAVRSMAKLASNNDIR